jgi:protein-S-isoprenylcysteine O-methyltransferase Ste14
MKPVDYRGLAWTAAQWLGLAAVFWTGWRHDHPEGAAWISIAGGMIMAISLVSAIVGFCALGTNLSPWPQPHATNKLVTHGIYRRLRHPLYLSLILLSVGWAAWRQSWPAVLATAVLIFILRRKAAHEEFLLRQRYAHYSDYARTSGCFLPRWRA